jgi:alkylation response protein AidB-like acyl-CoA dehydrogenase
VRFDFTDEQEMLRRSARDFVARVAPAEQAKEWDEQGDAPALFKALADVGWFSLPFPVEAGGDGGGPTELLIIAEELGRASFDVAMSYIGVFIPGMTLWEWGSEQQRSFVREQVMTGKRRLAVSLSEPDAGSDAAALRCRAEDRGDHFVLNGQKAWCTGAGVPDTSLLMYVRTGASEPKHQGISLLLVDPQTPGVEVRRVPTLARHILGTNDVFLQDVVVPKSALVGPQDRGWEVMLSNLELERVLICGGYLGAAQATLDEMLSYGQQREAFGRPVATFQALAHAMADLQTEIDAARLLAYRAAWLHAHGLPCGREGAMAKLKGSETYVAAARLGMQVLAGHGFSTESVMSFRYRESIVATISGGTSQIQRNAIARSMGLRTY